MNWKFHFLFCAKTLSVWISITHDPAYNPLLSKRCENKWYPIYPNRVTTSNVDYVCLSVYKKLLTNQFSLTEVVMGFFLPEIRVFKFCSPNIENKTKQFFFFSLYSQHIFWVGFSTWKAGFRVYLLNLEIVSLTFSGVFILSLSRLIFRKTGSKSGLEII